MGQFNIEQAFTGEADVKPKPSVETLESRIVSLEKRVIILENAMRLLPGGLIALALTPKNFSE